MDAVTRLEALLPQAIRERTGPLAGDLTELRIRSGRPVELVGLRKSALCGEAVDAALVRQCAQVLSGHSLYAREEEMEEGYFTMEGGFRVGVCGRMAHAGLLTDIGSLCVRVVREVKGAADGVMSALYQDGRPVSALIISPPGLGKTTLLRDAVRQLSDGAQGHAGVRVGVADERGELAGCAQGVPTMDVGCRTDVMEGCAKREGMLLLLRGMNPQVIATDELGHPGDAAAAEDVMRAGVRLLASVHASDERDAAQRLGGLNISRFERLIVLGGAVGQVKRIVRSGE